MLCFECAIFSDVVKCIYRLFFKECPQKSDCVPFLMVCFLNGGNTTLSSPHLHCNLRARVLQETFELGSKK